MECEGEQGESQRRGDGMHSTRTSTALFNLADVVTANNHFDRNYCYNTITGKIHFKLRITQL